MAVNGDLNLFAEMIAGLEEQRLDEYLAIVPVQTQGQSDWSMKME